MQTPLPSEITGCSRVTVALSVRNSIQKSIPMGIFSKAFSLLLTISCLVFLHSFGPQMETALTFYSLISHNTLSLMSSLGSSFSCIFLPFLIGASSVRVRHCTVTVLYLRSVVSIRRLCSTNSEKFPIVSIVKTLSKNTKLENRNNYRVLPVCSHHLFLVSK